MKARILGFFFSLLIVAGAKGQTIDGVLYTNFNNYYKWKGGGFDSTLLIPTIPASIGRRPGAIYYKSADSSLYSWSGTQWRKVGDGGAIPTLQQVTTAGKVTTDTIKAAAFRIPTAIGTDVILSDDGQAYRASFKIAGSSSYAWLRGSQLELINGSGFNGTLNNTNGTKSNTINLPDSSGVLTQRVSINGTTYNTANNGVVDLGNTDTATVVKAYVTNAEAVTITKGQVVYIFGASGDRAAVKLAKNTSDTFSSKTLGIVRADIAAGQAGWVTTQGQVSGINLGAYTAGDILWLDSVPGGFTKVKPVSPLHGVFVGVVERANVGNGLIYVKPQNGVELDEVHNVLITSPTNNQVLAYTSSSGLWENKTVSVDTTSLSNRINQKLNISDTASMLNPYLRKADTLNITSLFNKASDKLEFLNEFYHIDNFTSSVTGGGAHNFAGQTTANRFSFGNCNAQIAAVGSRCFLYNNFSGNSGVFFPNDITGNPYVFETRVKVDTCTSTDTLYFWTGLNIGNGVSSTTYGTTVAAFVYDPRNTLGQGSSRFIQCVTSLNSTRTTTLTSNVFNPSAYTKLKIEVKNTEVKFYINGTLVATHTTNLPNNTTQGYIWGYHYAKTVGTTAMNAFYDYWGVEHYFDTNR